MPDSRPTDALRALPWRPLAALAVAGGLALHAGVSAVRAPQRSRRNQDR